MTENQKILEKEDVGTLSHELTYRQYLMNKGKIRELFKKISIPEYIALHVIEEECRKAAHSGRMYLKDLAKKMQLPVRAASKMVGNLKDRGMLLWSHDGKGSEGTYVVLTGTGWDILEEQEALIKEFYGKVIARFGKQNFIELLRAMEEMDRIMEEELEIMDDCEKGAVQNE